MSDKSTLHQRQPNFTIVANAAARDPALSLRAKGLLVLMLSMSDQWEFYISQLATLSTDGVTSVRSGLNELIEHGYLLEGERKRLPNGGLGGYRYAITDEPGVFDDKQLEKAYIRQTHLGQTQMSQTQIGQTRAKKNNGKEKQSLKKNNEKDIREAAAPKKEKRFDAAMVDLPENIPRAQWVEWVNYRKSKRGVLSELAAARQLKALANLPTEVVIETIERSIMNDWTGLFPPENYTRQQRLTENGVYKGDASKPWFAAPNPAVGFTPDPNYKPPVDNYYITEEHHFLSTIPFEKRTDAQRARLREIAEKEQASV